jgi:hypothetical protein
MDQLLGNDRETNNETTAVGRQQPELQWTGWKAANATMDTATEERCSLFSYGLI